MYPSVQSTLALASFERRRSRAGASISSALLPRRRPYERYRTDGTPKLAQHDSPKGTAVIAKKNVARRASLKAPTGVPGFDELSHGGLPRNRTTLVMGGPGTGKTVFALQTLVAAARKQRQPGIFVAFEERVLVSGEEPQAEATELQISTIADTWIHLSYLVRGGERNRALTIVK